MPNAQIQSQKSFTSGWRSLVTTPEVLRLINDITSCSLEWLDQPEVATIEPSEGLEFFPSLTMHFQQPPDTGQGAHLSQSSGGKSPGPPDSSGVWGRHCGLAVAHFAKCFSPLAISLPLPQRPFQPTS